MPTVLITGANKGLGLEFARQYAADRWRVIATCPDPAAAGDLRALPGDVRVERLDVTAQDQIDALADALAAEAIDLLLLNAGVHLQKDCTLATLDPVRWLEELRINVIAPIMVARRFVPHVARSRERRIVAMSSSLGSHAMVRAGSNHAYRSAKAALNMALGVMALELKEQGITVVPVAPGMTRTDMGGPDAPFSAEDSVAHVRRTIAGLRPGDTGRFLSRDASALPW